MRKGEIESHFDKIVAFAEAGRFFRYAGETQLEWNVLAAFAVAAHLGQKFSMLPFVPIGISSPQQRASWVRFS